MGRSGSERKGEGPGNSCINNGILENQRERARNEGVARKKKIDFMGYR